MSKGPKNPYKDDPVLCTRPKKPLTVEEARDVIGALCAFHGISEKDPAALGKLAICLAHEFVPALRPRKRAGRPADHSARDIMWAYIEYGQMKKEAGSSSTAAIIEKMTEDKFWQDMGLGKTQEEVKETLRYILTDRINQPEIASSVRKEFQKLIGAMEVIKKPHRH